MSMVNAFRRQVLRSLDGRVSAAQTVCKLVGIPDVSSKLTNQAFVDVLGAALNDVPLEVFDDAIRQASPIAAHSKLRFDLDVDAIAALADEVITRSKQIEDGVAAVPDGKHTFENTVLPLADQERILSPIITSCEFMQHVHADKGIRDACADADKKVTAYFVESGMRKDVFDSLVRFDLSNPKGLDVEDRRLLDRLLRDFRRNGLELDEATRTRVQAIQKEITEKQIEFSRNLGEENSKCLFTEDQLEGMPSDFLERLNKSDDGRYIVTMKYPESVPVMKLCKVEDTRRQVEFTFNSRCKDPNTPILERLLELRHEKANLLGFPDHATYTLDIRMAKSPVKVREFLETLNVKLQALADKELAELLELKRQDKAARGEPFDGRINQWDFSFYLNLREKTKYDVDHEVIKQYFPLHVVMKGMLEIYQKLLSLKFTRVDNAKAWHDDVELFAVHDSRTGTLVGYFYLDLHPREGKYGHAAVFGLQAQCNKRSVNAGPQIPVAAMVTNFTKPTPSKPSLLRHQEVVTLFHEFGHVMHQLCSNVQWARFSGTRVERDFVECPSQMLENWCWEASTLLLLSGHVDDNSKKLPDDLIGKLVRSKNANAGLTEKRQLLFGLFDQTIHSRPKSDTKSLLATLQQQILGVPMTPGTNFAASFGHLAGGYDSQYYGYMWSSVYSMDMFASRFKEGHLLDPAVGDDYRNMILAPGGSRDAIDSLRQFLGREPNQRAFLLSKGLSLD
ncbi:unnamed protein product (mitochondrion) [Plasmodiophora brassicae]|uniref:Peptidase M3A/M3B catalytic domain-containing protein n=1 Tax=Plasmodiophora brassicae TaxID=37360 RepID=A0A0G4IKL2_PLABS|nr:hypothetical protein PBRA_004351 [Plasmodiophora brassicae]SPR00492.1 unnamed protein product [Plasmodiophora brassicae]